MGVCLSCCGQSAEETNLMPSPVSRGRVGEKAEWKQMKTLRIFQEERRQQQLDAAEKRRQENEQRGIKNPESVRRQQQRAEELQRREEEAARQGQGQANLRVIHLSLLAPKVPLTNEFPSCSGKRAKIQEALKNCSSTL